jgi:DAK2 domain fusion protein YloV
MVIEIHARVVDGQLLKWLVAAGVSWLETHKQKINNMNVFPVPDGDTGTNMLMTIRKAYQAIATMDEKHIGIVAEQIARGALTGARGNSGTILSMLLRGFSQELKGKSEMDAVTFANACQRAVDYAYETVRSVMEPVEGTILTVAREAAAALKERATAETNLRVLLTDMVSAAYVSLENTPNLLPKLKEAGVVDSGGMGLVYFLEGMKRFLEGQPVAFGEDGSDAVTIEENQSWQDALVPDDEEGYGYDVQFLMIGKNMDVAQVRRDISDMGWSPLVDGDESLIKVHVHVHNPGDPLSYAIKLGVDLDDIVVENMQAQYLQYVQARSDRESADFAPIEGVAVVTVARGDGLEDLFRQYGAAYVVIGGQTMNPSTEDFLSAIESLNANEIILLPNNGNVIMAAQQAASVAINKQVKVVPSKTMQQGITALVAAMDVREEGSLEEVYEAMTESLSTVVSGEVTTATRNANIDGVDVQEGDFIGLLNNKLVFAGDTVSDALLSLLQKAKAESREILTLYYGEGVSEQDAEAMLDTLTEQYPNLDAELVYGGQPLYPYLISIE